MCPLQAHECALLCMLMHKCMHAATSSDTEAHTACLATAYNLVSFGACVTVYDDHEAGDGGASAVAAGMLHPLTPRGKLIWGGKEGLAAAMDHIEAATRALHSAALLPRDQTLITAQRIVRPIMDARAHDMYAKAAAANPQWLRWLTTEELCDAAPGTSPDALAGVEIAGAIAIDSRLYLRGLWEACRQGGRRSATGASTSISTSTDAQTGASSEAGGRASPSGERHGTSQSQVEVDTAKRRSESSEGSRSHGAGAASAVAGLRNGGKGGGARWVHERLTQAAVGALVEGENAGFDAVVLAVGFDARVPPPRAAAAAVAERTALMQKVIEFYPAAANGDVLSVTAGVRVIRDRSKWGRIPLAGRVPGERRQWALAALGARGLIHHALIARSVAAAAICDDDSLIPQELQDGLCAARAVPTA
ncbi:hypothetical protein JKP88DRAFT_321281 [Tribonema minus]|uniref:FAD dependent oxidoreductase domain-containing protein n=1 Tax=Tribonema minus TaxID=303371 RepID=A0A835YVN0_9STRA|nr:hypothetical protein JKP88DRAFT_321281 [Tribonema minus]